MSDFLEFARGQLPFGRSHSAGGGGVDWRAKARWDTKVHYKAVCSERREQLGGWVAMTKPGSQEPLLVVDRKNWVPDSASNTCLREGCPVKFSLVGNRRHHCRYCGLLVCAGCSQYETPGPAGGASGPAHTGLARHDLACRACAGIVAHYAKSVLREAPAQKAKPAGHVAASTVPGASPHATAASGQKASMVRLPSSSVALGDELGSGNFGTPPFRIATPFINIRCEVPNTCCGQRAISTAAAHTANRLTHVPV